MNLDLHLDPRICRVLESLVASDGSVMSRLVLKLYLGSELHLWPYIQVTSFASTVSGAMISNYDAAHGQLCNAHGMARETKLLSLKQIY